MTTAEIRIVFEEGKVALLLESLKGLVNQYAAGNDHIDGHSGDDCWLCKARKAIKAVEEANRPDDDVFHEDDDWDQRTF